MGKCSSAMFRYQLLRLAVVRPMWPVVKNLLYCSRDVHKGSHLIEIVMRYAMLFFGDRVSNDSHKLRGMTNNVDLVINCLPEPSIHCRR